MKKTKIDLNTFDRKFAYEAFKNFDNPYVTIICEVDITNLVDYTKTHKNFYHSMCYLIMKAMNNVKNFGYRFIDGEVYHFGEVGIGPVGKDDSNNIFFYHCPYTNTLDEFLEKAEEAKQLFLSGKAEETEEIKNEIYASCFPWRKMSSLSVPTTKNANNPQVIWDKFETKEGKTTINLFAYAHHSFCDGSHFAMFFDEVERLAKEFPNI